MWRRPVWLLCARYCGPTRPIRPPLRLASISLGGFRLLRLLLSLPSRLEEESADRLASPRGRGRPNRTILSCSWITAASRDRRTARGPWASVRRRATSARDTSITGAAGRAPPALPLSPGRQPPGARARYGIHAAPRFAMAASRPARVHRSPRSRCSRLPRLGGAAGLRLRTLGLRPLGLSGGLAARHDGVPRGTCGMIPLRSALHSDGLSQNAYSNPTSPDRHPFPRPVL